MEQKSCIECVIVRIYQDRYTDHWSVTRVMYRTKINVLNRNDITAVLIATEIDE